MLLYSITCLFTPVQVQRDLGCKNAWTFDITAACSGFVVGLITATRFIKGLPLYFIPYLLWITIACRTDYSTYAAGGGYKNVLVIGADALSRYVDWTDRGTCIIFGDAAGALLVQVVNTFIRDLLAVLSCVFYEISMWVLEYNRIYTSKIEAKANSIEHRFFFGIVSLTLLGSSVCFLQNS